MSQSRHILVVGAGAVGAFYGARLHDEQRGVLVSAVCRSNYAAVSSAGFRIESLQFGTSTWRPHGVFRSCADAAASGIRFDAIVVATKALPDVRDDSVDLDPLFQQPHHGHAGRVPTIVLIQNGFGVEWPYRARFPAAPILSAITVVSCQQTQPGVIVHNKWTRISIGPFFTSDEKPAVWAARPENAAAVADANARSAQFVADLAAGGIRDSENFDATEIQLVRWHKLAINATFNPTSILSGGLSNPEQLLDDQLEEQARGCILEILNAGPVVLGAPFPPHLATADALLASTKRNRLGAKPSMLVDWEAGRPLEIEVILANPLKLARQCGVEMPRIQTIYALIRSASRRQQQKLKEEHARQGAAGSKL
ncbi:hypothetical protein HK105_202698 [Polyrhizophydium stewartii]|uniref:2-dehydropantoate 2-reductase n=1 Tax=Polyrhizophydium stewartii TaxID=2732419 RepID=A0ABR4NE55_9FUNG|nr:hypothetical protein HK105_004967 [Polyrhizophydium stewartii]